MTYPPQQPGPYGNQPDPYGSYGQQPPQQPAWGGGWDQQQQQPGYGPQSGGFPQQQPGYGPPPQQPGWGGYPPGPPPRKKTGLIAGLAIGGVLLVGGGVTAVILLTGDDKPQQNGSIANAEPGGGGDGPQGVVQRVISAIDDKDTQAALATLCDSSVKSPAFELDKAPASVTLKASQAGEISETGDNARARLSIKVTEGASSKGSTVNMSLTLKKKDGKWCVSNASMGGTGTSRPPSASRPSPPSTRPSF